MTEGYRDSSVVIYQGDVREVLRELPDESVHCVVTSPPYWGLRDYGCEGQIGLEDSPVRYVAVMRAVFAEVRRVLRADGTLWLNMGDSYAGSWGNYHPNSPPGKHGQRLKETPRWNRPAYSSQEFLPPTANCPGLKPKDLVGMPWRIAFALQASGWYLRQDIIWAKPNPMPESVTDRCTKSHEYIFLMAKSERYYWNQSAISEPCVAGDNGSSFVSQQDVLTKENLGTGPRQIKRPKGWASGSDHTAIGWATAQRQGRNGSDYTEQEEISTSRNRRSVWNVSTEAFPEAHFATFPQDLIKPCILAGCPEGGTVLDPFMGSGTTGLVAKALHSKAIGIELNPDYIQIAEKRLRQEVLSFQ